MNRLSTDQLQKMRKGDRDVTVVNVLGKDQFRKEHIPGSINVPSDEKDLPERIRTAAQDESKPVVVHCSSESCDASRKAGERLEAAGFSDVYHYAGGMEAWKEAGNPVEEGVRS